MLLEHRSRRSAKAYHGRTWGFDTTPVDSYSAEIADLAYTCKAFYLVDNIRHDATVIIPVDFDTW